MYNQQTEESNPHSYIPLNIHPNPYGLGEPVHNSLPPMPEPSPQRNNPNLQNTMVSGPSMCQQYSPDPLAGMPQQNLPSRDIPMNTLEFQHDAEVQQNYIPPVKLTSDYIREYEKTSQRNIEMHEKRKRQEEVAQDWFSQLQVPILVAILYFVFQMPIVNTLLRKIPLLHLYKEDGHFNLTGLLFKSMVFGMLFYFMQTASIKLSSM